jgi:hypothetical protein
MPEVREVCLGDGFGDVAVKVNGARIEVHPDGSVDAYTDATVRAHPGANGGSKAVAVIPAELQPGDRMEDGTIFAGISPDTRGPMFTTPHDAPLVYTFNQAAEYAQTLNSQNFLGHNDWRVPSKDELNVLFNNRAAIGGFNVSGWIPAQWRWSSSRNYYFYSWAQRFSDGHQSPYFRYYLSSLRCVRG